VLVEVEWVDQETLDLVAVKVEEVVVEVVL